MSKRKSDIEVPVASRDNATMRTCRPRPARKAMSLSETRVLLFEAKASCRSFYRALTGSCRQAIHKSDLDEDEPSAADSAIPFFPRTGQIAMRC
ncbi:MAG: hypothetical protein M3P45_09635 [Acidobacteriota bacterium]|nr:hypothetical protein [Acidobacteriota bacterium]